MTALEHNLKHVSPQIQVSVSDLSEQVLETKREINKTLIKIKNDLFVRQERVEKIALMCGKSGNDEIVPFAKLLRETGDINILDENDNTILIKAAYCGNDEIIRTLLSNPDILINEVNSIEFTALISATFRNNENIALQILEHPYINL